MHLLKKGFRVFVHTSSFLSAFSIYLGPSDYWMVLPTWRVGLFHSVYWPTHKPSLETPTQTLQDGCFANLLGVPQSSQIDNQH